MPTRDPSDMFNLFPGLPEMPFLKIQKGVSHTPLHLAMQDAILVCDLGVGVNVAPPRDYAREKK